MMRKIMILCYMVLLSSVFIFPQTGIKYDREMYLAEIFKVHEFKEKYEIVDYIYKHKERVFFKHHLYQNDSFLNRSFKLIKGNSYVKEPEDSLSIVGKQKVEFMSKEEMNSYLNRLNYTPEEAYKDYKSFIQNIKLKKDIYLKYINEELEKSSTSEFEKDYLHYDLILPGTSLIPPGITKLDFLKVFKEFILEDDEGTLPNYWRVKAYLKCRCKI